MPWEAGAGAGAGAEDEDEDGGGDENEDEDAAETGAEPEDSAGSSWETTWHRSLGAPDSGHCWTRLPSVCSELETGQSLAMA